MCIPMEKARRDLNASDAVYLPLLYVPLLYLPYTTVAGAELMLLMVDLRKA